MLRCLLLLQWISPFLLYSTSTSTSTAAEGNPSFVNYLVECLGFSNKQALSTSTKLSQRRQNGCAKKGSKLLEFLSLLLEHPIAKPLLLKEGTLQNVTKVLGRVDVHGKSGFDMYNCCVPVLRSLSLFCDTRSAQKLYGVFDGGQVSLTNSNNIWLLLFLIPSCSMCFLFQVDLYVN